MYFEEDEQRDYEEESYWGAWCPLCECSPCNGGGEKGSCEPGSNEIINAYEMRNDEG